MTSTEMEAFAFRTFAQNARSVDTHVGDRIRRLRSLSALGIEELAKLIGVSALRMQYYEFGASRITAEHLRRICDVLDVPPSLCFAMDPIRAAAVGSPIEPSALSPPTPETPSDQAERPTAKPMARIRSLSK